MKKLIIYIWIVTVFSSLLLSCIDEDPPRGSVGGPSIPINIGLYPSNPDTKITGFRIIAFDRNFHAVRSNVYYSQSVLTSPLIQHQMAAGTYDFVFIANEPLIPAVTDALNGLATLADLDNISFPSSAIIETKDIPMMYRQDDVEILYHEGNSNFTVRINGEDFAIWNVVLERMAARFDITLHSTTGAIGDLTGVTFHNIPDALPLTGNYTGPRTTTRTYTVIDNPSTFVPATVAGAAWAIKVSRVILPTNMFTPKDDVQKAISMSIQMAGNSLSPSGTLGVNEANHDYTIPHNTYFQVDGTVKYPIEMNITPANWTFVAINGGLNTNRTLNISATSAMVNERNTTRIYFSSNQSNVTLEATGMSGVSGTTPFNVNDIFPNVAGVGAANFHYTQGTSAGYFDLYTEITPPNSSYRIYLNAFGLRREIVVNTAVNILPPWTTRPFVGTFHRWNQTGERLITASNTGAWTASIEYPAGQTPFVVLSTSRSTDPLINTPTPGNPEEFQVTDGVSTPISANGQIYFRVGLTGKLASATTQPRYARIKLDHAGGTSYIYVRQGEAADYLMRPTDPINSSGVVSATRPLAKKFAAFNLTDPQKVVGPVDRGTRGYVFTDYPSQAGYLFQWSGTKAWSPGIDAAGWVPEGSKTPWDSNPSWETSPSGYRRFNDGSTSTNEPAPTTNEIIMRSEARQSLWLNPVYVNQQNNNDNLFKGFFADGFFDRRALVSSTGPNPIASYCTGNDASRAYFGSLFYNPVTYASLFLPQVTQLFDTTGMLFTGSATSYRTSTTTSGITRAFLSIGTVNSYMGAATVSYGGPIRPVAQ